MEIYVIIYKETNEIQGAIKSLDGFNDWLEKHNQDRNMDFDEDFVEETEDDFELIKTILQ